MLSFDIMNFYIHKITIFPDIYDAIVQTSIRNIKINIGNTDFRGVKFCLLRDNFLNYLTN